MEYYLENDQLSIRVSSFGGELQSMMDRKNKKECLWQGDSRFWEEKAPNLFPYIARLTQGKYTYRQKEYFMEIHGLAKYREMKAEKRGEELIFTLDSDEETMKQYPFRFRMETHYRLERNGIVITFRVENRDSRTMYFGIGGHPGFQVPYLENTEFSDYVLQFPEAENPVKILFSDDCFGEGEETFTEMEHGMLRLNHRLFDHDAIVLKQAGHCVRLCIDPEHKHVMGEKAPSICVRYPEMKYVGFWHAPKTEAPYLCIEPWSSLPSRKGIIEDLEKQENLLSLEAGKQYENTWEILLEDPG